MNRESLYRQLPIPLQQIACSLEGWRIQRTRYGGDFDEVLVAANSRSFWSYEQVSEFRNSRLRAFICHCARNVPYYRRKFSELGINPEDIRTLKDLEVLPVLTKAEVQDCQNELRAENYRRGGTVSLHTSGTTGAALQFTTTWSSLREHFAMLCRYHLALGISRGTWCGTFCGRSVANPNQKRPPYWRYNLPGKQILFSAYHFNSKTASLYVAELRRRRPEWLHGYPSFLSIVASYIVETGDELGYKPKWITASSENLLPLQVKLIESAFGTAPFQYYSNTEGVASIAQCPFGNLHVDEDFSAVEFIPRGEGQYTILGTNVINFATPLLRYDTKDIVEMSEEACGCGRPGRVVRNIDGRLEDHVVLRDGSRVGRMDHIFKDMVNVREAQLYQSVPGEIVARVVRGPHFTSHDELMLLKEFDKRLGNRAEVRIEFVDVIARERNGKLRFVISESQLQSHRNHPFS